MDFNFVKCFIFSGTGLSLLVLPFPRCITMWQETYWELVSLIFLLLQSRTTDRYITRGLRYLPDPLDHHSSFGWPPWGRPASHLLEVGPSLWWPESYGASFWAPLCGQSGGNWRCSFSGSLSTRIPANHLLSATFLFCHSSTIWFDVLVVILVLNILSVNLVYFIYYCKLPRVEFQH